MSTEHYNVRQHLLDTGTTIITGKSSAGGGLNKILTAAGVPKASFYPSIKPCVFFIDKQDDQSNLKGKHEEF
jgi:hypothetical protein